MMSLNFGSCNLKLHRIELASKRQPKLPILTQAHTITYKSLKALPDGADASIGLVHHHIT